MTLLKSEQREAQDEVEELLLVERTLGMAMKSPAVMERLVRSGVTSAEFKHEAHSSMFSAMLASFAAVMRCDGGNVEARMRDGGWRAAEAKRWVRAAEEAASGSDVDDETLTSYIERIRTAAALRRLRVLGLEINQAATKGEAVSTIAARVTAEVDAIVAGSTSTRTQDAQRMATDFVKRLQAERDKPIKRAPLGIAPLDAAMRGGPRLGSVLVFGADTGVGKTTFTRHMILSMLRAGRRVLMITFESPASSIYDGLVESVAGLRLGNIDHAQGGRGWGLVASANGWLASMPLWVDDSEAMTVEELSSKVHSYVKREQIDVVFIDYVQDIERSTRHSRDDLNFAHISKRLRQLTQRYPLLLVENAQLSDGDGKRTPAEIAAGPTERNLAFTKQWAKDASYIVMADRPKLSEDEHMRDVTRLRLVKNRLESVLARGWMKYDQSTTRLADCDAHGRVDIMDPPTTTRISIESDVEHEWDRLMDDIDGATA